MSFNSAGSCIMRFVTIFSDGVICRDREQIKFRVMIVLRLTTTTTTDVLYELLQLENKNTTGVLIPYAAVIV